MQLVNLTPHARHTCNPAMPLPKGQQRRGLQGNRQRGQLPV